MNERSNYTINVFKDCLGVNLAHRACVAYDRRPEELPSGGSDRAGDADGRGQLVEALERPVVHGDGGGGHEGLGRLGHHAHQARHLESLLLTFSLLAFLEIQSTQQQVCLSGSKRLSLIRLGSSRLGCHG